MNPAHSVVHRQTKALPAEIKDTETAALLGRPLKLGILGLIQYLKPTRTITSRPRLGTAMVSPSWVGFADAAGLSDERVQ